MRTITTANTGPPYLNVHRLLVWCSSSSCTESKPLASMAKSFNVCWHSDLNGIFPFRFSYVHKVLTALIFSCLGDALLNHGYFVYGMGAFAVAQIFYIMAFGFKPLKLWIGILLYSAATVTVLVLWNYLDAVILIGLPIYTMLLVTMCWRSLALLYNAKVCDGLLCCLFQSMS